jgi:hypothetical protein
VYRELLKMRKTHDAFRPVSRAQFQVALIAPEIVSVRFRGRATEWLLLCDLHGGHECSLDGDARVAAPWPVRWRLALSSNEARFAGNDERGYDPATARATFARPEAIVLEATA